MSDIKQVTPIKKKRLSYVLPQSNFQAKIYEAIQYVEKQLLILSMKCKGRVPENVSPLPQQLDSLRDGELILECIYTWKE